MRLFRFTKRAFHDGRLIEPGEEVLCRDDVIPGAHMIDVATGVPGYAPPLPPDAVFRAELAKDVERAGPFAGAHIQPPVEAEPPPVEDQAADPEAQTG